MKKIFLATVVATILSLSSMVMVSAAPAGQQKQGGTCGGVDTAIISCDEQGGKQPLEQSAIWGILKIVLNVMTGLVGIAAVGGLVYGGIMYASAQDNASQVQEAIGIIRNVIIGIVLYMAMFALLQYLIPGGVFN